MYISYNYTKVLIDYCLEKSTTSILEKSILQTIPILKLNSHMKAVSIDAYIKVLDITLKHHSKEQFISDVNGSYRLSSHGFLGLTGYCCPNIKEVLQLVSKYSCIEWPLTKFKLIKFSKSSCAIKIHQTQLFSEKINQFIIETSIISLALAIEEVLQENIYHHITITHNCNTEYYKQRFPNIRFQTYSEENLIILPIDILARNIKSYNEESYRLVLTRCESALEETKKHIYNIKYEVLQIIENHEKIISMNELASILKISSRTLTRKLKKYDLSFTELITKEKLRRTNNLLKTNKSISIIARELSFNDSTAFCRFVRNHFACSPTELKKRL